MKVLFRKQIMNAEMSENKQTTDSELLLQIVGYNAEAFEQLYNRYSVTIYSVIKEIVTNPKLAEKITLNVFSVFLKRIEYFSTTNNTVFTHLTLLARNVALDVFKRMKFVEDIPIYSDEYEIDFILPNLSSDISPINLDDRDILGEKIKTYKSHLTEVQNLVLSLVYFEGLNEEEIAKRLNVPVITGRQRIIAIMENLHQQYREQGAENTKNNEVLNLIKLEALGCLLYEERMMLNQLKENDPDFPWKELGEYQNLTALLSTSVPAIPPQKDLKSEVRNIFVNILKGSEVDYPIVASELPIVEPITDSITEPVIALIVKPIPDPVHEPIANPITEPIPRSMPQEIVMPEIKEKQETEFQMKFRDPDPKALRLIKKMETVQTDQKPTPVFAKTENGVQFKDYNAVVKKPNLLINKTASDLTNKEVIQAVVREDGAAQNKLSSNEINKPDLQIKNTDPSPIIECSRPVMVKDISVTKNRLIPNSSINLKDFLKKEESIPGVKEKENINTKDEKEIVSKSTVPGINKSGIKTITSEPPKDIKITNPFIDNIRGNFQNKSAATIPGQSDIKIKTNETPKQAERIIPSTEKDEKVIQSKPVIPVNKNSDIKIRTNEPPKEILSNNPFVGNEVNSPQSKSIESFAAKSDINIRKSEPSKDLKNNNPFVGENEKSAENKSVASVVEKSDIKIRTNELPKELRSDSPFIGKNIKLPESKIVVPVVKKPDIEIKENKPPKEANESNTIIEGYVKALDNKATVHVANNSEIKLKAAVPFESKVEKKSEGVKKENSFQRIKPSVDKTSFKIRETNFVENDKKPTELKPVDNTSVPANTEAKTAAEQIVDINNIKESINIDEVLTKLDDTKTETLFDDSYYNAKVKKIRRKSRRNILAAAALFAVLVVSGIFIILKPQNTPVKVASEIKTPERPLISQQANFVQQQDSVAVTPQEDINNPVENTTTGLKKTEPKISLPPLPKTLTKEESTYFALNEKSDLLNNTIKENSQTAAAKTENIVPPKEEKIVEEEPAFFVAVEEMPELIGGIKGLQGKIVYPKIAEQTNTEGKVLVQAVVDENGKVISANVIKGIGAGCDEVATDAVLNSKFKPGKQRGKNVKVQLTIPIVFKK